MTAPRQSPPVSWLLLEQYALGELEAPAAARVAAAVETDADTRACLDRIRAESAQLPPLVIPVEPERARRSAWLRGWRAQLGVTAAALAVATILILVLRPHRIGAPGYPERKIALKGGGELTLGLIRERNGAIDTEPTRFAAGDRFKVAVTCAPITPVHAELVVYQDGEAAFPLPSITIECGNRVVVPGAFRIDGDAPAAVCLALGEGSAPHRAQLSRRGLAAADRAACIRLEPSDPRR